MPTFDVPITEIEQGINIIELLAEKTSILSSKSEARRSLKENSISVNKEKITDSFNVLSKDLLNQQYVLIQKGKKNYYIIRAI